MSTLAVTTIVDQARTLRAGDTVLRPSGIDLRVTDIRPAICGFVTVEYAFAGGSCHRTIVADEYLTIARPDTEETH